MGLTHGSSAAGLGHGQQMHRIGRAGAGLAGGCNSAAHKVEIVGNHGHNRPSVPNNIK
jgi:hypothetical protein